MDRLSPNLSAPYAESSSIPARSSPEISVESVQPGMASSKEKKKRNRVVLSCLPCHERKQQCDRSRPCSRCISRGLKDHCVYEEPIYRPKQRPNLGPRIDEPINSLGIEALLRLVQANQPTHGPTRPEGPPFLDQTAQIAAAALSQLAQKPGTGFPTFPTDSFADIPRQLPARGLSLENPADLRAHFPNHTITSYLLHHFFENSSVPWLWSVVHRPLFDRCFLEFSSGSHPPSLDFVALLSVVCALSLQALPEHFRDPSIFMSYEDGHDVLEKRLHDFAHTVLALNDASTPTFERVQALALLAIYEMNRGLFHRSINLTAISIRSAQSLSMHQAVTGRVSPRDTEICARLWCTFLKAFIPKRLTLAHSGALYTLDRHLCFIYHRPYMIIDWHCTVRLPRNLDQAELEGSTEILDKPPNHITEHSFHILQIRWAKLSTKLSDHLSSAQPLSYGEVLDLDAQFHSFERDFLAPFTSEGLQYHTGKPYTTFQSCSLRSQLYHTRVILLRGFLLPLSRREETSSQTLTDFRSYARRTCLTFSTRLLALHVRMYKEMDRCHLHWADLVARTIDCALTMVVAVISGSGFQRQETDNAIDSACFLLERLSNINPLASKGRQSMNFIRKRMRLLLEPDSDTSRDDALDEARWFQEAKFSLSKQLPDLFHHHDVYESFWQSERMESVYFPGMDILSSPSEVHSDHLGRFLDSCAARSIVM